MSCETEKTGQGDPLCLSLVHQHLLSRCPSLAAEFNSKYSPPKVDVSEEQVLTKTRRKEVTNASLAVLGLDFLGDMSAVQLPLDAEMSHLCVSANATSPRS